MSAADLDIDPPDLFEIPVERPEDPAVAILRGERPPAAAGEEAEPAALGMRLVDGGSFVFDQPEGVPAVWGSGDEVLWSRGEALWLVGPTGVGKTTVTGQLVRARLGLADHAIAWPVVAGTRKVLYLAMDRPAQIARSLRRHFTIDEREHLAEHLVVQKGPPPLDVAKFPDTLRAMCAEAGADTLVIDSVKDAALKLSDDETGSAFNRAVQAVTVEGVEVLCLHHQRKSGADGNKPKTLADVYGSTWLTAGAGSVLLLWGQAGDPLVELLHLKQPAEPVGPLSLEHDHRAGVTRVESEFDALAWLRHRRDGGTAVEAAVQMFGKSTPTPNDKRKAGRKLDRLVSAGLATKEEGARGGAGGSQAARYQAVMTSAEVLP